MKEIGRNSNLNKNKIEETLKKAKIKNKIEKIGFFDEITKMEDIKQKVEKMKNNVELTIIYCNFLRIFFYTK
jgi:hypothetical protein